MAGSKADALAAYKSSDYDTAWRLLKVFADQGDAFAQFSLGYMCRKGQAVPQDNTEAIKWYRKAAEQGLAAAQSNIGFMYQNGQGVPQNLDEAANWYRKAAEQGDSDARLSLDILHESKPLIALVNTLSAGDISVVQACLQVSDGQMMTVSGRKNDIIWSEMEKLGWMRQVKIDHPVLGNPALGQKAFSITARGREGIPRLLSMAANQPKD